MMTKIDHSFTILTHLLCLPACLPYTASNISHENQLKIFQILNTQEKKYLQYIIIVFKKENNYNQKNKHLKNKKKKKNNPLENV